MTATEQTPARAGAVEDVLPVSPLQEGLLFHSAFDGAGPDAYSGLTVLRLGGHLDPARLRDAAAALVGRHTALRSAFRRRHGGEWFQVVARTVALPFSEHDLRSDGVDPADGAAVDAAVDRLVAAQGWERLDLGRPPLLRFLLVRTGERSWRLALAHHHLIVDGWSMPVLLRELLALYRNGGDADALGPVRPYRDFLTWLGRQDPDAGRRAWTSNLEGLEAPTLVAPDAAPAGPVPVPAWTTLDADTTDALRRRAREQHVTVNTLVQVAWSLVLARTTGRDDVVTGVTVSGRPPELDGAADMVGLFVNTVALRVRLDPAEPVGTLVRRLQREQAELVGHQHVRLTDLHHWSGHPTLFDTSMAFENFPVDALDGADGADEDGLRVEGGSGATTNHYPLTLYVLPTGERMRLRLDRRPDVVDEQTARTMLERVAAVVATLATDPDRPTAAVTGLDDAREAELLALGDGGEITGLRPDTIPDAFARRVAERPDRVAVRCGPTTLTYADLDARSDRLARFLLTRGAAPESRVALRLGRDEWLPVALLGILKAGCCYVPIDPRYPRARTAEVLDGVAPLCVLVGPDRVPDGSDGPGVLVLGGTLLDGVPDGPLTAGERPRIHPRHAAYVIHTSGSTGRPKGVVVEHAQVTALLAWALAERPEFGADTVVAATAASFDVSVADTLLPLLAGGGLDLLPDVLALAERPDRGADLLCAAPSALGALLDRGAVPPLGTVVTAGERLPSALARGLAVAQPGCTLVNAYGPTETTVYVTAVALTGDESGEPPLGDPFPGTRLVVLDAWLRPTPPGVQGEIYIAGEQVTRGYWAAAGRTAERYVADPFGAPGARMYRSGDLARWRADGSLEFLGRGDGQVKVRGVRVELGEIESVLLDHPDVGRAAATVHADTPAGPALVAHVVPADPAGADPADVLEHLRDRLPESMVPTAVALVDDLPVTTSGKLDRAALQAPDATSGTPVREARDPREDILTALFGEVLGVDGFGPDDDFFDHGGHSLLATRLVGRVRSTLDVAVDIRDLFAHRSPAALARVLGPDGAGRPPLRAGGSRPSRIPLSAAQNRLWFLHRLAAEGSGSPDDPGDSAYHVPLALRLDGELDVAALRTAVTDVVARHESLRTLVAEDDQGPHQNVLAPAEAATRLRFATRTDPPADGADPDRTLRDALRAAVAEPFDLRADLPLRAVLHRRDGSSWVLAIVAHHIAVDGWSLRVLARDLAACYTARLAGTAPGPRTGVEYADAVLHQRALLGDADDPSSTAGGQLAWWRERLDGLPDEVELPADRPRDPSAGAGAGSVDMTLPAERYDALRALARATGTTPFMIVQAVLAALLSRLGAGDDVPIGTPVAGRTDPELDDVVGLFVNTLVLRTDTGGDPSLRTLLARVRTGALDAYARQDVPFERLVSELNPARAAGRHPLFQVALAMQNLDDTRARPELPGLESSAFGLSPAAAKLDLSFVLWPDEQAGGTLRGALQYDRGRFDPGTAEALAGRLLAVLGRAVAAPDTPLSELDVLLDGERERLAAWGRGDRGTTHDVVALFCEQAAARPDEPAVRDTGGTLDYRELHRRAGAVARELIGRGLGAEDVVGIWAVPDDADTVSCVLGVLMAGAAYLPLDPAWPAERVRDVTERAGAALVLAPGEPDRPDRVVPAPVVAVQEAVQDGPEEPGEPVTVADDRAAYVLFTSGSTGRPKGVVVERSSLGQYVSDAGRRYPDAAEVGLLHSPLTFDLTLTGLLTPLTTGGCVVLRALDDPGVDATGATFLKATPSHLPLLERLDAVPGDGTLVLGGEQLTGEALRGWRAAHPDAEIVNAYGPTELTVNCTEHRIGTDPVPDGPVPIGRPLDDTEVFVLDTRLRPVPVGVTGELYVAGAAVTRGYLGRPDATAERFVAHPDGTRVYRTGDLVRWTGDGELVHVGRGDDQVKVRGFRIELGEVERALAAAPGVAAAAAAVHADPSGDRRLVGYAVPSAPGGAADLADLADGATRAAADRLPAHAVPSDVVVLEALPLTAHGKLDRSALPAPRRHGGAAGRAPRTDQERTLCALVSDVLGADGVTIDDDFFALGGHSLLAIRLTNRIKAAIGVDVRLRTVFEARTVAALADRLDAAPRRARPALRRMTRPEET